MFKLNLFPLDELKVINTRQLKTLRLLAIILVSVFIIASIVMLVKLFSLRATQTELTKSINDLSSFASHQKEILDELHKKQEKIMTNIASEDSNVDVANFLRLLVRLKTRNTAIYEIKADGNQINFVGFSNTRKSAIEFFEQFKLFNLVQKVSNFAITKVDKNVGHQTYPLTFSITIVMKKGRQNEER